MKSYIIKENKNNLRSKKRFYKDKYLLELINIITKYKGTFKIHNFVRDLLYVKRLEEYDAILTKYLIIHNEHPTIILQIYGLFTNWSPFETYNMGQLKGNYLELLSYSYMRQKYSQKIYEESNIILDNYQSHTWDLILELNEKLYLYECKFSAKILKRKHIDQMTGLKNRIPTSSLFLVIYDTNEIIKFNLKQLRKNTGKYKYDKIIHQINFITIENFTSNPF